MRLGAAPQRVALPHIDAADARSAQATHIIVAGPPADAPALRRPACLGLPRRTATLNKLPKLPEALALARKPNVRLVLGFQGRAQLETRYGPESEAMLSQPATKVFLRTSEPRAREWVSKALGEIEF